MHHLPLALGFGSAEFSLIIVALALGFPLTIACFAIYMKGRQREMWHETARIALEKGQPIPLAPPKERKEWQPREREGNDIKAGLILIAVGAGLYLFFRAIGSDKIGTVGAIPGFIGVALLLYGVGHALFFKGKSNPDDRPPQP